MSVLNIIVYGLAVIILVFVVVYSLGNNSNNSRMSFMESLNLTGIPVVTFYNNGNKFNFILDTGANKSIIDSNVIESFKYKELPLEGNVMGMEGNKQKVKYVSVILDYKNNHFEEQVQVLNMKAAFDNIKKETGVSVCGILGSDFFKANKYVLDFKDLIAYIKR